MDRELQTVAKGIAKSMRKATRGIERIVALLADDPTPRLPQQDPRYDAKFEAQYAAGQRARAEFERGQYGNDPRPDDGTVVEKYEWHSRHPSGIGMAILDDNPDDIRYVLGKYLRLKEQDCGDESDRLLWGVAEIHNAGDRWVYSGESDADPPDHTRTTNPDGTRTPRDGSTHCTWTEDEDGIWNGSCGVAWECPSDTPAANAMQYCPQCGKPLVHAGATPSMPNIATKTTKPLGKPTPDELVEALRYVDGAPHTIINAAGYTTDEARTLAVAVRELAWAFTAPPVHGQALRRYRAALTGARAVQDTQ